MTKNLVPGTSRYLVSGTRYPVLGTRYQVPGTWYRVQGCASWDRNSKAPKIRRFCHQMGRHPTIWDARHGFFHRISARISPDRVNALATNWINFPLHQPASSPPSSPPC